MSFLVKIQSFFHLGWMFDHRKDDDLDAKFPHPVGSWNNQQGPR